MQDVTARLEIPTRTIFKVMLVLATLWFLLRIGPVLYQLFGGLLLALALYPPVARLQARGLSKGRAILAVVGIFLVGLVLALLLLVPRMVDEGRAFWDDLPGYIDDGAHWFQEHTPWIYDRVYAWALEQAGETPPGGDGAVGSGIGNGAPTAADGAIAPPEAASESAFEITSALSAGQGVVGWIGNAFVAIILAIYFLTDGERAFAWLSRDLTPRTTARIRRAAPALSVIVSSYVARQGLSCVICGVYTFIVLALFGVPSALILATIAALTDAVPLIGVVIATVPAVLVALTQGWETALLVFLLYILYQVFENYILVPRLYGRHLQLSSFGMLMAVLIGWKLLGLAGVLLALPTAAALLVIERVWTGQDPGIEVPPTVSPPDHPGPAEVAGAVVDVAEDLTSDLPTEPPAANPPEAAAPPALPPPTRSPAPAGERRRRGVGRRGRPRQSPTG